MYDMCNEKWKSVICNSMLQQIINDGRLVSFVDVPAKNAKHIGRWWREG